MARKRLKKEQVEDSNGITNEKPEDKPKDSDDNKDKEVKKSTTSVKTSRKKSKPSEEFKCGECNDVFNSESDANKHVFKEHYGLARINDCSKTPFTEREIITALIKAQKSFKVLKCKNNGCDKTFKSGLGLKMHWDLCGKSENEISTVCDVCGKRLKNSSFAGHLKTHKIKEKSVSKPKSPKKDETNNSGKTSKKRLSAIRAKNTIRKTTKGEVIISGSISDEESEDSKTDSDETEEEEGEEEVTEEEVEADVRSQLLNISSQNVEQNFKCLLKLWSNFIQSANDFLRDIPKGCIESWRKEVAANGKIKCPLEGCSQWFTTRDGLKYHYKRCGINLQFLWKCKVCQFEAIKGNRIIIQHLWSAHKDLLPKISIELAACVETANVTTSYKPSAPSSSHSYKDFHKKFFKQKSFTNLKPNINSWIEVNEDEFNIYLPNLNPSVPFRSTLSEEKVWIRLNIFQSIATKKNLNFFCGGPIWAADWCPTPLDSDCTQYLAVASNMNHEIIHTLNDTGIESGLIQIWSVGQLKREFDPSIKPQMVFSIAHFCGMIWDMEWCPGGTAWDEFNPNSNQINSESLPRLGLLAIACGDGFIRIHSIPHPQSLPKSCNYTLYYNEPVIILNPPGVGNSFNCENTICKSLSWIPSNGQNLIVGGYGSGVIAVWDLTTKSSLLIVEQNPNQRILRPLNSWIGHNAGVNRIKWVPNSSDQFVVSASFDRSAKLWNLRDLPVPITVYKRGLFTAIDTNYQWNGMFLAGDDCYQGFMNNTVFKDFGFYNFGAISLSCHKSCVWDLSVSQWTSATVSVDASGEAVIFPHFQFKAEQKRKVFDRIPLYHISTDSLNQNSTETTVSKAVPKNAKNKNSKKDTKKSSDINSDESEPPLRTYKEFSTKYGLLFNDYDVSELKAIPQNEINRIRLPTNMQYQRLSDYPLVSINRVSWNPNNTSCAWILSATQSGLCRLSCVPFLNLP